VRGREALVYVLLCFTLSCTVLYCSDDDM
jgi:hypothetical protein